VTGISGMFGLIGTPRLRDRIVAAAALAATLALAAGAFQTFYLRIYTMDRAALHANFTAMTARRIPGLHELLLEVERRTPPGAKILLVLPHTPWQNGYGYGFRRAQYLLAGREVIPLIDRRSGAVDPAAWTRAEYVACWRGCAMPPGFQVVWQQEGGLIARHTPGGGAAP
jgi:hypothetical protein